MQLPGDVYELTSRKSGTPVDTRFRFASQLFFVASWISVPVNAQGGRWTIALRREPTVRFAELRWAKPSNVQGKRRKPPALPERRGARLKGKAGARKAKCGKHRRERPSTSLRTSLCHTGWRPQEAPIGRLAFPGVTRHAAARCASGDWRSRVLDGTRL